MLAVIENTEEAAPKTGDSVVCHCHQVRASEIKSAMRAHRLDSVEAVTLCTRAGSGCGACRCRVQRMVMGLPTDCGPCAFCTGCNSIKKLCTCDAAAA